MKRIGLGKYPESKVKFNEISSSETCGKVDPQAEAEPLIKQNSETSEMGLQYLFESDQDWDGQRSMCLKPGMLPRNLSLPGQLEEFKVKESKDQNTKICAEI